MNPTNAPSPSQEPPVRGVPDCGVHPGRRHAFSPATFAPSTPKSMCQFGIGVQPVTGPRPNAGLKVRCEIQFDGGPLRLLTPHLL